MLQHQKGYFGQIPYTVAIQLGDFLAELNAIIALHRDEVLAQIEQNGTTVDGICEIFACQVRRHTVHAYCRYAAILGRLQTQIEEMFGPHTHKDNLMPMTTFLLTPFRHLENYLKIFRLLIEDFIRQGFDAQTPAFKSVAVADAKLQNLYRRTLENYKLNRIRNGTILETFDFGLVKYSDVAKGDSRKAYTHRLFVTEHAVIAIKIKVNTKTLEEKYVEPSVVVPMTLVGIRGSHKDPKRVKFYSKTEKYVTHAFTFKSVDTKQLFCSRIFS